MKIVSKMNAATSIIYYTLGAMCLIMLVKTGMSAVDMVKAAMITPDDLFTNKIMYANMVGLGCIAALMYIVTRAFQQFFNLGLYYWKLAFGKEEKEDA